MQQIPSFLKTVSKGNDISLVLKSLATKDEHLLYGLTGAQKTVISAIIANEQSKNMLICCDSPKRAKEVWDDLNYLLPDYHVLYFPALEVIPFEILAQSAEIQRQRLQVLANLVRNDLQTVVVCPAEALAKALIPPHLFREALRSVQVGKQIDLQELLEYLVQYGYERVEQVESSGQFSIRGGILDVFCILYEQPLRIEFFDDEVDSIRFFDLETQRSLEKVHEIQLVPAREFFLIPAYVHDGLRQIKEELAIQKERLVKKKDRNAVDKLNSKIHEVMEKVAAGLFFPGLEQFQPYFYADQGLLLDYFPANSVFCLDEPIRIRESLEHRERERNSSFADLLTVGSVLPKQSSFFFSFSEILGTIEKNKRIYLSLLPKKGLPGSVQNIIGVETKSLPPFFSKIRLLADEIKEWKRKKFAVIILLTSQAKAQRLQQGLSDCGVEAPWVGEGYEPQYGQAIIAQGNLSAGMEFIKSRLVIVTENEIFQQAKKRSPKKMFAQNGQHITRLDDLKVGDYVVHSGHGIGRYLGVERLTVGNIERDYLIIKYAGEDRLYVPTDQVELLQKYIAGEGTTPKVHKLGGTEWQRTKLKVTSSVKKLAEGLLELYAKRQGMPGFSYSSDDNWQREFEDAFPYKETPDQLKAINEVKKDMQKSMSMDRLICGDVGYGKTEVAIRAAFKAVSDDKQVAILVPTTVLAQQHYNTFRERFANYPVQIEVVSRFKTPGEQKKIIENVKAGTVDIVIGTHRLLSKDICFKDLGLLIIDEEQRFGVTHKEKIKRLKSQVDVLTLSATPIPRTLHMSLVGIRDMSVIETPPEDRYPIQTYVVENSPELIKDAVRRELGRGGQVFYVHNRVEDIEKVAEDIRLLVPEARLGIAHGQMKEDYLERVMMQFMEQELDVLVCTTIIETGLDISNVNTLIIDEADKMGLSQLYQLRGRVGRTNRVAYAYLTYKKDKILSQLAEKRLHAIREFTELGSGFKIAMRDLEIRGAGNLLGPEQHGHVSSVGFDMYCRLLEEAVRELKGDKATQKITVEIDLQVSSFIPEYYVSDSSLKLEFYQRIRLVSALKQVYDLEEELEDRFGDLPLETRNLLYIAKLKVLAGESKIRLIKQKDNIVSLNFAGDPGLTGEELLGLAQQYRRKLTFSADSDLVIKINVVRLNAEACLALLEKILMEISTLVSQKKSLL
ncbi:MAG: transcription-repair coupling factor [Peptococcaceae bacterium]